MLPEFQTAIHQRLTTDAGLIAVVPADRIGNHVLDDAEFPHIDWRLEDIEDGAIKSEESYEGSLILEVFSDYNGDLECYQIHQLLYTALQRNVLTVAGADNPHLTFNSLSITTDDDNRTRQATINYSFMLGES